MPNLHRSAIFKPRVCGKHFVKLHISSVLFPSKHAIACALLYICSSSAAESTTAANPIRYKELAKVIDRNVGRAHMTRGVNVCTILALKRSVSEQDIEVLSQLLESKDSVHRLATGYVLSVLGPAGISALRTRGARLGSSEVASIVSSAENTRSSIAEYEAKNLCGPARSTRGKRDTA